MSQKRNERLVLIRKIFENESIGDQETLRERLKEYGIDVTQATLSRDLRDLGVQKKRPAPNLPFRYMVPTDSPRSVPDTRRTLPGRRQIVPSVHFLRIEEKKVENAVPKSKYLRRMLISGPFVVLITEEGFAQVIAKEIDKMHDPSIVATIAGYDTLLVIPSEHAKREQLQRALSRLFPELA